jgi:hypothetical protein
MLNSLRVPERLFAFAMWVVSVVFAGFLIGLGGKIIGELPGVDRTLTLEQFMPADAVRQSARTRDSLQVIERELLDAQERASQLANATQNAYTLSQSEFRNWVATRTATTDPQQDPEVIRRTRQLDTLGAASRSAQRIVDSLSARLVDVQQATQSQMEAYAQLQSDAMGAFERALFWKEMRVFLIRLALTLPLLLVAGWLILRKRKSDYWPLARGFVLFALFAFFVELVPYLPSYGGYVRYGVGIIATLIAGHYIIRAFRRYLAQRQVAEQLSEPERRRTLGFELALKRMSTHVCPACERPIATAPGASQDFCVYCGLRLFDDCGNCGTHKNAFFQYCPKCGATTSANETAAVPLDVSG